MANIIFGDLRNYWKNVSDWVTGSISNILPKVQISEGDNTLKVNSDGSFDAQLKGSIGEQLVNQYVTSELVGTGTLTWETVYETTQPFVLDHLEWATNNYADSRLGFNPRINFISGNLQSNYNTFSPQRLEAAKFPFFDVIVFDTDTNLYRFRLREKMFFPNGIKIERGNQASTNIRLSVAFTGRIVK